MLRIEDLDASAARAFTRTCWSRTLHGWVLCGTRAAAPAAPTGLTTRANARTSTPGSTKAGSAGPCVPLLLFPRPAARGQCAPHLGRQRHLSRHLPGPDRRQIAESAKRRPRPTGCGCRTRRSPFWTAAWAPTRRTCCGTAATFTCAGRTACSPISWPWWWTMPAWGSPRWCAGRTCCPPRAAAVPVPSAGPAGSNLCPLPAAAGPGRAAAVQAGRGPEPGEPAGKIHRAGDRGQAGLCLRPAAGTGALHAGKPHPRFFLGKGAQAGRLPAGGAVLNQTTTKGGSARFRCAAPFCFVGHCPAVSGRGILKEFV